MSWLTTALKLSIKTKNRLYIQYEIYKTAFIEMQYISHKNKLKYLMKIQEIKYYNELINLNKNCMKKTHSQQKCWGCSKIIQGVSCLVCRTDHTLLVKTLRPRQKCRHFPDDLFMPHFLEWKIREFQFKFH